MVALAREQIFVNPSPARISNNFAQFCQEANLRRRVYWLLNRIFLPPEDLGISYPMGSSSLGRYLYYPVRLLDLLRRYRGVVWQLLRGNAAMAEISNAKTIWSAGLLETNGPPGSNSRDHSEHSAAGNQKPVQNDLFFVF